MSTLTPLMVVLLLAFGAAHAAEPVCTAASVQGQAQWQPVGGALQPLKAGQGLQVGAELRTGDGGRVRLRCVDGSTLVLADRSQLQIEVFEPAVGSTPRMASFMLSVGLLGQKVTPQPSGQEGGRWQVRTPSAVTAVRGTEFMVEVARDQTTAVHVLSGSVAVEAQDEEAAGAASSAGGVTKSIQLRALRPPPSVVLDVAGATTRCDARSGCKAAAKAMGNDAQRLLSRLGGL